MEKNKVGQSAKMQAAKMAVLNKCKKLFPKLFCNHSYKQTNEGFLGAGSRKFRTYKCTDCGKTKMEII